MRRAINRRFWDAGRRCYVDWRQGDEVATTIHPVFVIAALYHDVPDTVQTQTLLRYLCDEMGLPDEDRTDYPLRTFGYYHYFLDILFRYGHDDLAYTLLRRYYGRWLELGATTFGEFFVMPDFKGIARLDQEYEVHGYGTSAHLHFYTNILGVQPAAPGFTRIRLAPHPGDLNRAAGTVATLHGPLQVAWSVQHARFAMESTLPREIPYTVRAPRGFDSYDIRVNGQRVASLQ